MKCQRRAHGETGLKSVTAGDVCHGTVCGWKKVSSCRRQTADFRGQPLLHRLATVATADLEASILRCHPFHATERFLTSCQNHLEFLTERQ